MKKLLKKLAQGFTTLTLILAVTAQSYAATTLGNMANTVSDQFSSFATLAKYGALLLGVVLVIMGINDMRKSPQERQGGLMTCMLKVVSGVILCSIGWFVEVGTSSLGGSGSELNAIMK